MTKIFDKVTSNDGLICIMCLFLIFKYLIITLVYEIYFLDFNFYGCHS